MLFSLTAPTLAKFLFKDAPTMGEYTNMIAHISYDKWKILDFLVQELHAQPHSLWNVQWNEYHRGIWWLLEEKYKMEDVWMKKLIVSKFLDLKMVDSKTFIYLIHEV